MCAKTVIVLADRRKLKLTETFKVIDLDRIDVLISDLSSDDPELDDFRHMGCN